MINIKERHLKERQSQYYLCKYKSSWLKRNIPIVGIQWHMWDTGRTGKVFNAQVLISFVELEYTSERHIAQRLRLARYKLQQAVSRDGFTEEFYG